MPGNLFALNMFRRSGFRRRHRILSGVTLANKRTFHWVGLNAPLPVSCQNPGVPYAGLSMMGALTLDYKRIGRGALLANPFE